MSERKLIVTNGLVELRGQRLGYFGEREKEKKDEKRGKKGVRCFLSCLFLRLLRRDMRRALHSLQVYRVIGDDVVKRTPLGLSRNI